jgi:hypothetical protein
MDSYVGFINSLFCYVVFGIPGTTEVEYYPQTVIGNADGSMDGWYTYYLSGVCNTLHLPVSTEQLGMLKGPMQRSLLFGALPLLLVVVVDIAFFLVIGGELPPPPDLYQVMIRLGVVVLVAALAIIPNAPTRAIVAFLLLVVAIVAGFTIGLFYLPAVAAAVGAAVYEKEHGGQVTHRA